MTNTLKLFKVRFFIEGNVRVVKRTHGGSKGRGLTATKDGARAPAHSGALPSTGRIGHDRLLIAHAA